MGMTDRSDEAGQKSAEPTTIYWRAELGRLEAPQQLDQ